MALFMRTLDKTTDEKIWRCWAQALPLVVPHLDAPDRGKVAALLVQAMVNTKDEGTRYFMVRALSAVAVYLGAQDAEKVATLFLEEVTKPLGGSSGSRYPGMDLFLFSTVASRLKSKSPQVALQIIRAMGKTTNPTAMGILAGAFTSVAGDLEVKEAKEGVGLLMQIVSKTTDMEVVPILFGLYSSRATLRKGGRWKSACPADKSHQNENRRR